jgi:hypothetical protein
MGFVKNSGKKNACHVVTPDKLSVVLATTASAGALHNWRSLILRSPCLQRGLVSRFRNSHDADIGLWANFGIEGHQQLIDF